MPPVPLSTSCNAFASLPGRCVFNSFTPHSFTPRSFTIDSFLLNSLTPTFFASYPLLTSLNAFASLPGRRAFNSFTSHSFTPRSFTIDSITQLPYTYLLCLLSSLHLTERPCISTSQRSIPLRYTSVTRHSFTPHSFTIDSFLLNSLTPTFFASYPLSTSLNALAFLPGRGAFDRYTSVTHHSFTPHSFTIDSLTLNSLTRTLSASYTSLHLTQRLRVFCSTGNR